MAEDAEDEGEGENESGNEDDSEGGDEGENEDEDEADDVLLVVADVLEVLVVAGVEIDVVDRVLVKLNT